MLLNCVNVVNRTLNRSGLMLLPRGLSEPDSLYLEMSAALCVGAGTFNCVRLTHPN